MFFENNFLKLCRFKFLIFGNGYKKGEKIVLDVFVSIIQSWVGIGLKKKADKICKKKKVNLTEFCLLESPNPLGIGHF